MKHIVNIIYIFVYILLQILSEIRLDFETMPLLLALWLKHFALQKKRKSQKLYNWPPEKYASNLSPLLNDQSIHVKAWNFTKVQQLPMDLVSNFQHLILHNSPMQRIANVKEILLLKKIRRKHSLNLNGHSRGFSLRKRFHLRVPPLSFRVF